MKSNSGASDRLAKLQEKLGKMKLNQGGGGWLNLKKGQNRIRLIDGIGDMELFFQPVGTHKFPDDTKVYCPSFASDGELPCPVCEYVDTLYKGSKSDKLLAGSIRVQKKYWMNAVNRDEEDAGPVILTAGMTIFQQITGLMTDPEWGMDALLDEEDGYDLNITREGEGLDTKYTVNPVRKSSPLHKDPAVVEKWFDNARDLSFVEVSMDPTEDKELASGHAIYVIPYDRIIAEFDFRSFAEMDVPEDKEEEKPAKKETASRYKKVVAVEPLDEEDEDEDIYEEDDEEVPVEKNPARRRLAERSSRRRTK